MRGHAEHDHVVLVENDVIVWAGTIADLRAANAHDDEFVRQLNTFVASGEREMTLDLGAHGRVTVRIELKFVDQAAHKPSLHDAQQFVGGYVELLNRDDAQLLVNEEGRLYGMPLNCAATAWLGVQIVGPVLVLVGDARWD